MSKIQLKNNGISPGIKDKVPLKLFLADIFKRENAKFDAVTYIFCKDDFVRRLNKEYLNHDTLTDILTFTLSDKSSSIISEIYISVDRVKENALTLNIDYKNELLRVMIHGILHLCGYSDHLPKEKNLMRKKEDFYIYWYLFHVKRST